MYGPETVKTYNMWLAIIAAFCMICQDILVVSRVQAEARNRAVMAGVLDSIIWIFSMTTLSITLDTIHSGTTAHKITVGVAVTCANLIGTTSGVIIGKKLIKEQK